MRAVKPMQAMQPMTSAVDLAKTDDEKLARWTSQVGDARAQAALALLRQIRQSRSIPATFPELLAEVYLQQHNVRYEAQFDLGWARLDFALFDVPALQNGVLVWEVNGEYWHANTGARDAARKDRLLRSTARGLPILNVVECWESDIYQGESVFDSALQGKGLRGL